MLFRKRISRCCSYCTHGTKLNEDEVLCIKRGVIGGSRVCRKFTYDPCKRIPPKPKATDFQKYDNEDFSL